jgi:uncharacterized membrane protein
LAKRAARRTVDLAAYSQGAWLVTHGREPVLTITTGADVLASQAAFMFFPLAWLTRLAPIQTTLLIAQSAALALAVVPIWRIARGLAHLRVGAAFTLVVVYALYPTMHNLNLAGFYPETLALPASYAAYFARQALASVPRLLRVQCCAGPTSGWSSPGWGLL